MVKKTGKLSLIDYQQKVVDSKDKQVVLRWARRTGKDTIISKLAKKGDIVIHFSIMAARQAGAIDMDGKDKSGVYHITENQLNHFLGIKPKRVFLNEPAFFVDLLYVLSFIKRSLKPESIYLVGTPNLTNDILSSGFIFDAICARLEMHNLEGIYYSLIKYEDSPYSNEQLVKDIKHNAPYKIINEEILAAYNEEDS